jgi:septal ring factor EnvC (AmiA/AmiB activator)
MSTETQTEINSIRTELKAHKHRHEEQGDKIDELEQKLRNIEAKQDDDECLRHRVDPYSDGGDSCADWLARSRD